MIQINELIVVEVPKMSTSIEIKKEKHLLWLTPKGIWDNWKLPFPCEVIALASEVNEEQANEILHITTCLAWEKKGVISFMQRWLNKLYNVGLPTETSDYLFLKRKV